MQIRRIISAFVVLLVCVGCADAEPPSDNLATSIDLLRGFPATIVDYELALEMGSTFSEDYAKVSLRATIDTPRYVTLTKQLRRRLRPKAKESGVGRLGLADPDKRTTRGIVYFGPTSPAALTDVVNSALNEKKGCVVIVGTEVADHPWKETRTGRTARAPGGTKSVPVQWYWVSDATARPLQNSFRRAFELQLQPTVVSKSNETPLSIISPYAHTKEQLRNKTVLMPGGPAGQVFSAGTGGGDLNLAAAQAFFVKSLQRHGKWPDTRIDGPEDVLEQERVLLLMPCIMMEGKLVGSAVLPVETGVLAKQLEGRDRVVIKPTLP
ncbi:MAG: hypothetical protein MI757_16255 [Pirellulales bacterium]|nr:hypothetical protein [Pirellulales bacterium]